MKAYDIVYKYGHLYDKNTQKRLIIKDGAKITITIDTKDLLEKDPNIIEMEILNNEKKEMQIKEFSDRLGMKSFTKILSAGEFLYFRIKAGVRKGDEQTEPFQSVFRVRLLEDLYVYNKTKDVTDVSFFECQCEVEKCMTELEFFESIRAASLNDAYTKTYELYFAMFGKSTANAFKRFFLDASLEKVIRSLIDEILKPKTSTEEVNSPKLF